MTEAILLGCGLLLAGFVWFAFRDGPNAPNAAGIYCSNALAAAAAAPGNAALWAKAALTLRLAASVEPEKARPRLEKALEAARKAHELEPGNAGYALELATALLGGAREMPEHTEAYLEESRTVRDGVDMAGLHPAGHYTYIQNLLSCIPHVATPATAVSLLETADAEYRAIRHGTKAKAEFSYHWCHDLTDVANQRFRCDDEEDIRLRVVRRLIEESLEYLRFREAWQQEGGPEAKERTVAVSFEGQALDLPLNRPEPRLSWIINLSPYLPAEERRARLVEFRHLLAALNPDEVDGGAEQVLGLMAAAYLRQSEVEPDPAEQRRLIDTAEKIIGEYPMPTVRTELALHRLAASAPYDREAYRAAMRAFEAAQATDEWRNSAFGFLSLLGGALDGETPEERRTRLERCVALCGRIAADESGIALIQAEQWAEALEGLAALTTGDESRRYREEADNIRRAARAEQPAGDDSGSANVGADAARRP